VDVPNGMVHENIENICVEYGKTWGIHGWGLNLWWISWFCHWISTKLWSCATTCMGCKWRRRWCWWGGRRCLDQICDESNIKGPSPPICTNQHLDYDTLDWVNMRLQTFSLKLQHDFIFIWCSNVFSTF